MQCLCFMSLFCLETNSPSHYTIDTPLLLVPQPFNGFMLLRRHGWRNNRQNPFLSMSVLDSSGMDRTSLLILYTFTFATQSFLWRWVLVSGCLPVHWEGCHDRSPVSCFIFDTPLTFPPLPAPPPPIFIITLFRRHAHQFSFYHRLSVYRLWNMILLLINYSGKCYHTITNTYMRNLCSWCMYCFMYMYMQYKNEGGKNCNQNI